MQQTTNYNLLIPEGTDVVNPLTQVNPNFQTIDGAMFANKQSSIGTASEVVTGTVHAINRNNQDSDVFRFTATGAWTSGDTMTLDGQAVTVHLSDGTTPATNSYIIGAEVLAMVNGTLVTLAISTTPPAQGVTSFNSRTGAVIPAASDYDASMVDYDNTLSGMSATDVQSALDELSGAFEWKQAYTDASSGTITVSQDFREVMLDIGLNDSGTNTPRMSLIFVKGHATRKRVGYYSGATNFGLGDVTYDGNSTFTIVANANGSQVASYTNVYYR